MVPYASYKCSIKEENAIYISENSARYTAIPAPPFTRALQALYFHPCLATLCAGGHCRCHWNSNEFCLHMSHSQVMWALVFCCEIEIFLIFQCNVTLTQYISTFFIVLECCLQCCSEILKRCWVDLIRYVMLSRRIWRFSLIFIDKKKSCSNEFRYTYILDATKNMNSFFNKIV